MTASDRLVGTNVRVEFLPEGGTPGVDEVILTSDFTNFSWNKSLDTVDVTASNETERYSKPTIEGMEWTLMLFNADQAYLSDIQPRAEGLLSVYENGKSAGEPMISFNTLITGYSQDMPFDGALEIEVTGTRQGAMVADIGSVYTP